MHIDNPSVCNDIRLVLNDGKSALESATVPLRWYFSKQCLQEKRPSHVLIFVHTQEEYAAQNYYELGERYLFRVADAVAFIQFFRPGPHIVTCVAFSGTKDATFRPLLKERIKKDKVWLHDFYLNGERGASEAVVGKTLVIADIPEGVFAPRRHNRLSDWCWNFNKHYWGRVPRDQCEYRWRLPAGLFSYGVGWAANFLLYMVVMLVLTTYLPIARCIAFIIGYQPIVPWRSLLRNWKVASMDGPSEDLDTKVVAHKSRLCWRTSSGTVRELPCSIFGLVGLLFLGWLSYDVLTYIVRAWGELVQGSLIGAAVIVLGFVSVLCTLLARNGFFNWLDSLMSKRSKSPVVPKVAKPLPPPSTPKKLISLQLDPTGKPTGGLSHSPRVIFWAVKRRVCKPFAQ